jgi:hypothetical protein
MQYQIFPVTKRVYDSVRVGQFFQGGVCIDGTSDQTGTDDVHLLIIKYDDKDYEVELEPLDDRGNEP